MGFLFFDMIDGVLGLWFLLVDMHLVSLDYDFVSHEQKFSFWIFNCFSKTYYLLRF